MAMWPTGHVVMAMTCRSYGSSEIGEVNADGQGTKITTVTLQFKIF